MTLACHALGVPALFVHPYRVTSSIKTSITVISGRLPNAEAARGPSKQRRTKVFRVQCLAAPANQLQSIGHYNSTYGKASSLVLESMLALQALVRIMSNFKAEAG